MLELINLTKKYGDFTALDHLNASFDTGIYGLLGPNGAGKSTMLNLITDNIKRTEGSILYNGKDIFTIGSAYAGDKDHRQVLVSGSDRMYHIHAIHIPQLDIHKRRSGWRLPSIASSKALPQE